MLFWGASSVVYVITLAFIFCRTYISSALVKCRENEFRAIFLFVMKHIVKGLPGYVKVDYV